MRYRAIFDSNGLKAEIENDEVIFYREETTPDNRSDLASPGLIRDHIDPFKSMADGKLYDSKSAYRQTLRDRGLTEIGNDVQKPTPPPKTNTRREFLHKRLADVSDRQADKMLRELRKKA
jgi:hypothetical protein